MAGEIPRFIKDPNGERVGYLWLGEGEILDSEEQLHRRRILDRDKNGNTIGVLFLHKSPGMDYGTMPGDADYDVDIRDLPVTVGIPPEYELAFAVNEVGLVPFVFNDLVGPARMPRLKELINDQPDPTDPTTHIEDYPGKSPTPRRKV